MNFKISDFWIIITIILFLSFIYTRSIIYGILTLVTFLYVEINEIKELIEREKIWKKKTKKKIK